MKDEYQEYGIFWGDTLFQEVKQKDTLIENFFYSGDAVFLSAFPGIGKSIFTFQMIAAMTSGTPFLEDFEVPKPLSVLYVQTEGDRGETKNRLAVMQQGLSIDFTRLVHVNLAGIKLNSDEDFRSFEQLISIPSISYDVIVFDPLYTTIKGSFSDDDTATDWIRNVRTLRERYNCSFIIVHHDSEKVTFTKKGEIAKKSKSDLMGSTVWSAFANYNYKLYLDKDGYHRIVSGKVRNKQVIDELRLRMQEPNPLRYVVHHKDEELIKGVGLEILRLLEQAKTPLNIQQIINPNGTPLCCRAQGYNILGKLYREGKVKKVPVNGLVSYSLV